MSDTYHHLTLNADSGELHADFTCTAPEDAPCRRRPPGDRHDAEYWTEDEATEPGYPCWAVEWCEAFGIEDAVRVEGPSGVLAAVPVKIGYDEGVVATPIAEKEAER